MGYFLYDLNRAHDPKKAAKNVQCIHTSVDLGTWNYNCHQDWLMGRCGIIQPAADPEKYLKWILGLIGLRPKTEKPKANHSLCNEFYINAFENDFLADNHYNCARVLKTESLPPKFKMGYMEMRRK